MLDLTRARSRKARPDSNSKERGSKTSLFFSATVSQKDVDISSRFFKKVNIVGKMLVM